MQYITTPEQEQFRQTIRKLAEEKVAPRSAEIDRTGECPWDIFELFKANDLFGLAMPKECGGVDADMVTLCIFCEEMSRVDAGCSNIVQSSWLASEPILIAGSPEQKKKFLTPLARGDGMFAFGLTERDAGSDVSSMGSTARLEGDKYILNGSKCFITNGSVSITYSIFAKTDPDKGTRGISAFIVPRETPGFSIGKVEDKLGIRGSQVAELIFEDCPIPRENLLGEEGRGFYYAMMTLDRTRPHIAAQAVGIAQGALDYVVKYAKERVQFKTPIANLQGIQFMLADMVIQAEAARAMVYRSASAIDNKVLNASHLSAIAKTFASDTAMKVTTDAVQIMGGYGYMKEQPVERMMRDAKITQIYEGTNQIQRVVISRALLA